MTAVPLLVFVIKLLVATPVGPVGTVAALIVPNAGSSIEKATVAPGTYCPDERFLTAIVMTDSSYPFAITQFSLVEKLIMESALPGGYTAETDPTIRIRPSTMKSPAFARIANTLETRDALAKYIIISFLKNP
jgi:hypothetical protein